MNNLHCTLNMIIAKEEYKWVKTRNKKLDNLIRNKQAVYGINDNHYSVIINLSSSNIYPLTHPLPWNFYEDILQPFFISLVLCEFCV